MKPSVSVIIATYNRGDYLGATLESIFAQSFRDFEVIVVDDGSTDATRRVIDAYGSRVHYIYQDNRGPSAARNLGVRHARANWISIQDSDDLSLPNHLDDLHGYVTNHPEVAMVFANGSYLGGPAHNRETIIPASKSRRLAGRPVRLEDIFDKSIVRLQAGLIAKKMLRSRRWSQRRVVDLHGFGPGISFVGALSHSLFGQSGFFLSQACR